MLLNINNRIPNPFKSIVFDLLLTSININFLTNHMKRFTILIVFVLFCTNTWAQLLPSVYGDAASLGNDCYQVTPALNSQGGWIYYSNIIDFSSDFSIVFNGNFGSNDANGADGMTMVMKSSSTAQFGDTGGGLGYDGISSSMAVEFDTWQNAERGDPTYDHIALISNGSTFHTVTSNLAGPVQASSTSGNIEDGNDHLITIIWTADTQTFKVLFDCSERITYTGDLVNNVFGGTSDIYFGFTGSTGGFNNLQQLCFEYVSFANTLDIQDQQICAGESVTTIDATYPEATSYEWVPDTGVSNPFIANPTFTPSEDTTYTVYILDNCGILLTPTSFTVTVDELEVGEPTDLNNCDIDGDGLAEYDLTQNDALIINGQPDLIIAHYPTETNAENGTNPISNPETYQSAGGEIIYVKVESNTSGCSAITSFNLILDNGPTVNQPNDLEACDDNNDGLAGYNLTSTETEIINGQTGLTITFYQSQQDAQNNTNSITTPQQYLAVPNSESIYVRIEDANGCTSFVEFSLNSGEEPVFNIAPEYEVCNANNGSVDLTVTPVNFNESEVSVTWYDQENNLISGQEELTLTVTTSGAYTVQVEFNDTNCSYSEEVLVVENCDIIPQVITPNGDDINDYFDLSTFNVQDLKIYNRYGTLVYSKSNYTNEWFGQSDGGDELPVGTYFFTINYGNNEKYTSWVYITR